jgi:histidinol-phosphate aminotransferase
MTPNLDIIDAWVNPSLGGLAPKKASPERNAQAIRLDKGELPYSPSPRVVDAIATAATTCNRYPDVLGGSLRAQLAAYAGTKPDQIIIGNGSDDLIELIIKVFVQPGEQVLLPVPTFFVYGQATQVMGGVPIFVQRRSDFGLDVETLVAKVTPVTKVLYIANPNNPTANLVSRDTLGEVLNRVNCMVVVDECYFELCQTTIADWVDQYPHLIVLRSLSKSFGLAGLRIGYAIAHAQVVDYLYRAAQLFPVNTVAIAAALAALEDQAYIQANIHRILSDKLQLQEQLEGLGLQVYPSVTNFLFVNTQPLNLPSDRLVAALQERNIWVADFGNTPGLGAYYFRIAVGTPAENQGFLQGLADAILSLS